MALAEPPEILPLDQVRPGMQGYGYTVFAGSQVERFDLEVIGVMPNLLGPRQSIILVQLKGPKVEHTGVVAGMSGSPVYIQGKLAGALSLKLGVFTKEPLAGVTPIEDVLHPSGLAAPALSAAEGSSALEFPLPQPLSPGLAQRAGLAGSAYLQPIETPLVFSGFQPEVLWLYAPRLENFGMVATQGGSVPAGPDDGKLAPGEMASMVLVQGEASIYSACTVTAVEADRVFLCGHQLMSMGDVQWPMARAQVLTTLSSDLASTKIVNVAGTIGTIFQDRLTAVVGRLGPAPPMIPLELSLSGPQGEKKMHFELVQNSKLTPVLVAVTTLQGLTANALYREGATLRLAGEMSIRGHSPVRFEDSFAPLNNLAQDGLQVAASVQSVFSRIFSNPYEMPTIDQVSLRVESVPERQSAVIEGAWTNNNEVSPGEHLAVRVQVRPYRGAPRMVEVPIVIPDQVATGATLRLLVSDSGWLTRTADPFAFALGTAKGPGSLDQLIAEINRERSNDRLYVGLLVPAPTLFYEQRELPSAPLSEMAVLEGSGPPGSSQALRESLAGEWSLPLNAVVTGAVYVTLKVK